MTYEVLDVVGGTFSLFILIIIAFYSGELVWRERDAGLAPIFDALPIPRWVIFTSKLLALMAVQVILVAVADGVGRRSSRRARGTSTSSSGVYARTLFGVRLVVVLDPLRDGDARARRREQQVRRPLRDDPLLRARRRAAAHGARAPPLPPRVGPLLDLLGDERLRPVRPADRRLPGLLGGARRRLRDRRQRALGARDGDAAQASASPRLGDAAPRATVAALAACAPRLRAGRGRSSSGTPTS